MKGIIFIFLFSLTVFSGHAQEWFTSFDVAKRLARVQNKMLFVLWEESFYETIPVLITSKEGKVSVIDLANDNSLDAIIWTYFVPVRLQESQYQEFINKASGRSFNYVTKLNDNSIKIMDINGNILNVDNSSVEVINFTHLIEKYALDTSFLNQALTNYANEKNFLSTYLLAEKYIELSVFVNKDLRSDIIDLANIYLVESEKLITETTSDKTDALFQKLELLKIEEVLILNKFKKAVRQLDRIDENQVDTINQRQYGFLKYIVFKYLKEDVKADLWKSKISSLDLKKAELILNIMSHGRFN